MTTTSLDSRIDRTPAGTPRRGLQVIVAYKIGKGVLQLLLAAAIVILMSFGLVGELREAAAALRHHFVGAWSEWLASGLMREASAARLALTAVALVVDAALAIVEGLALHRGRRWGAWLVVGATSMLVPFEIFHIAQRLRVGRVLILIVNLGIVAYLWRRALAHGRGTPPVAFPPNSSTAESARAAH